MHPLVGALPSAKSHILLGLDPLFAIIFTHCDCFIPWISGAEGLVFVQLRNTGSDMNQVDVTVVGGGLAD